MWKLLGVKQMKTTLVLALVTFSITLGVADSHARPHDECLGYAADANTSWASNVIMGYCLGDESFFFKSKKFACAIEAGAAKTEKYAKAIFVTCLND